MIWLPSDSREHRQNAQAGVPHQSIHCLIGTDPLVVRRHPVDKEKASTNQRPFRHSVWDDRGQAGEGLSQSEVSRHWVRRVLSSATGDPYKLRCVSTSGSVLEFLLLQTLRTGAVGGTPTA